MYRGWDCADGQLWLVAQYATVVVFEREIHHFYAILHNNLAGNSLVSDIAYGESAFAIGDI